jgi:hypothetical protein
MAADMAADMAAGTDTVEGMAEGTIWAGSVEARTAGASMAGNGICTKGSRYRSMELQGCMGYCS